jgi:predicted ribosome-associated RNA-binding protein Tma20
MDQISEAAGPDKSAHKEHDVKIIVNGDPVFVPKGKYVVSNLKSLIAIPAEYELDLVVNGQFQALEDGADIHIKGGEEFVGHVRQGGSS